MTSLSPARRSLTAIRYAANPITDNSWLHSGTEFPSGGLSLKVEYRCGSQSSHSHLPTIGRFLSHALSCQDPFQGSLNFYATSAVTFPEPARVLCVVEEWLFVPVVINEQAVGLAARRPPPESTEFIEVFACEKLAPRLGLKFHDKVTIRLLSGGYLSLAV